MIKEIVQFKRQVEDIKNEERSSTKIDKGVLCKILVMANIAEMCIWSNVKVPESDRHYFEGQAFVGRYFDDWALPWVGEEYLKLVKFIKSKYW